MRDVLAMEQARLLLKGMWFIARYAQTTSMTHVATSDQPILDLCWAQESFIVITQDE